MADEDDLLSELIDSAEELAADVPHEEDASTMLLGALVHAGINHAIRSGLSPEDIAHLLEKFYEDHWVDDPDKPKRPKLTLVP